MTHQLPRHLPTNPNHIAACKLQAILDTNQSCIVMQMNGICRYGWLTLASQATCCMLAVHKREWRQASLAWYAAETAIMFPVLLPGCVVQQHDVHCFIATTAHLCSNCCPSWLLASLDQHVNSSVKSKSENKNFFILIYLSFFTKYSL